LCDEFAVDTLCAWPYQTLATITKINKTKEAIVPLRI
jgi:hypothetical protein